MRLALILTALVFPSIAAAEPVSDYRLQTAGVDALAFGTMYFGHHSETAVGIGAATYVLGSAAVHAIHHSRLGSALAVRLGVPAALAAVGYLLDDGSEAANLGLGLGAVAGMVVASGIDIGYLSRADDGEPSLMPAVVPVRDGGMTFGLAGSF